MNLQEETWKTEECGNPKHGPTWGCWNVTNQHGQTMLRSVTKDTADRYAALPQMVCALRLWLPSNGHTQECGYTADDESGCSKECAATRKALKAVGVPMP